MTINEKEMRTYSLVAPQDAQGGPGSAGQSGAKQGLSDVAEADSESVKELVGDGQNFEAEVVMGVKDAPDADVAEVRTKQFRDDDVPAEYLGKHND